MSIKRRTVLLGGSLLLAADAGNATTPVARKGAAEPATESFDGWTISDIRSGGTAGISVKLPAPKFRTQPQCVVTQSKMLGPCRTNDVAVRSDITEGVAGLPMRVSLRVVDAAGCKPVRGADIEIWHSDVRGVYSGRATAMCNRDDEAAKSAGFLRGRQITDADGVASFLTVYPGWYSGRAPHIHVRVLVDARELLVTQLLFDDALNDFV